MALMGKLRLADQNLNIKVRELLSDFGFGVDRFDVLDSYPSDREKLRVLKMPTVVVSTNTLFGSDVELGSTQWPTVTFNLDVYAQTDGQRDDLAYHLWGGINEKVFTFYDFNAGFPNLSTAISYSGLNSIGEYYIDGVNSVTIAPPKEAQWEGEKHQQLLFGIIRLSNG